MIKVRCKNCNVELTSHTNQTKCCGCDNLTTITADKISALDLSLVELIKNYNKEENKPIFSKQDLEYQEARRNRKVKKLNFEIR